MRVTVARNAAYHTPLPREDETAIHFAQGRRAATPLPSEEKEKAIRFAQWKQALVPASPLLKAVGDTISASWDVTNNSAIVRYALLDIFFIAPETAFTGLPVSIPPGATVKLAVSGVITTLVPGTTYNSQVRIREIPSAPNTAIPGGVFSFVLTIKPATYILTSNN